MLQSQNSILLLSFLKGLCVRGFLPLWRQEAEFPTSREASYYSAAADSKGKSRGKQNSEVRSQDRRTVN